MKNVKKIVLAVALGFLMTFLISVVAAYTSAFTAPPGASELVVYASNLYLCLLIWFAVAAAILLYNLEKLKMGWKHLIWRQIFLWGPVSVAWSFTVKGYDGALILGMMVSSSVLIYQAITWQKAEQVDC